MSSARFLKRYDATGKAVDDRVKTANARWRNPDKGDRKEEVRGIRRLQVTPTSEEVTMKAGDRKEGVTSQVDNSDIGG